MCAPVNITFLVSFETRENWRRKKGEKKSRFSFYLLDRWMDRQKDEESI